MISNLLAVDANYSTRQKAFVLSLNVPPSFDQMVEFGWPHFSKVTLPFIRKIYWQSSQFIRVLSISPAAFFKSTNLVQALGSKDSILLRILLNKFCLKLKFDLIEITHFKLEPK